MKKIPCLFQRDFTNRRHPELLQTVTPGCEWALAGEGVATLKLDGTACRVLNGRLYKRYDCKRGQVPPVDAIACCPPDPETGHWPHWVRVTDGPGDQWHREAWAAQPRLADGTYELVGPKINGNPHQASRHVLIRHGRLAAGPQRTFGGLLEYLCCSPFEGLVFWRKPGDDDSEMCKIRRADYCLPWPLHAEEVKASMAALDYAHLFNPG